MLRSEKRVKKSQFHCSKDPNPRLSGLEQTRTPNVSLYNEQSEIGAEGNNSLVADHHSNTSNYSNRSFEKKSVMQKEKMKERISLSEKLDDTMRDNFGNVQKSRKGKLFWL